MTSDYDDHSQYQRVVARSGTGRVDECIDALPLAPGTTPVVVDLGAATGRNSMVVLRHAVERLHAVRGADTVVCVHNDLPTNDWDELFASVTSSPDSYARVPGVRAIPTASAVSFFGPTVAAGSAHLEVSSSAAHWLRSVPTVAVHGLYACEATGADRGRLADAAARDWRAFLEGRAADLVPGGRLLVQCVGTAVDPDGTEHVTARALLATMSDVADAMAADGLLDPDVLSGYVFGVYPRTAVEAAAPFEDADLGLRAVEITVDPVANPYLAALDADGDTEAYATAYTAFVRGFTESALTDGLFTPSAAGSCRGHGIPALVEEFYRRLHAAFAADPQGTAFRDWTLTVVAERA